VCTKSWESCLYSTPPAHLNPHQSHCKRTHVFVGLGGAAKDQEPAPEAGQDEPLAHNNSSLGLATGPASRHIPPHSALSQDFLQEPRPSSEWAVSLSASLRQPVRAGRGQSRVGGTCSPYFWYGLLGTSSIPESLKSQFFFPSCREHSPEPHLADTR
jgi:hypothetical protein